MKNSVRFIDSFRLFQPVDDFLRQILATVEPCAFLYYEVDAVLLAAASMA